MTHPRGRNMNNDLVCVPFDESKAPTIAKIANKSNLHITHVILSDNIPIAYTNTSDIKLIPEKALKEILKRKERLSTIKKELEKLGFSIFSKAGHNLKRISPKRANIKVYAPTYYVFIVGKNNTPFARISIGFEEFFDKNKVVFLYGDKEIHINSYTVKMPTEFGYVFYPSPVELFRWIVSLMKNK